MVWAIDGQQGNRMRSLTVKLLLAFALVSLVGVGLVALISARFTGDQFREFFEDRNREALLTELADYYRQNGSWVGIDRLAARNDFMQKFGWGFAVVDTDGNVVLPSPVVAQFPTETGKQLFN